jgi:hypothetical protein
MAQHANGKTTTDGLVFMYDTGDIVNSYRGEPTTNQFLIHGTSGYGPGADNNVTFPIQGTSGFIRLGYGQTFGGYIIKPEDVVYKYNLGGYGCHYHGNSASIPAGSYVTFTFDYYVSPGTTIETNFLANIENYGGSALGGSVSAPNSLTGVWQTVSFTAGPTAGTGTQAMFLYPGACGPRFGNTGFILYKNPQVEWKSHPTPFVQGTRSNTQGLLPLINNSTLDLSNVSFDSNAQIIFDGTNDYISIPRTSDLSPTTGLTQEVVFKTNSTSGQVFIGLQYGNSSNNSYALWYESGTWYGGVNIGGTFYYPGYTSTISTGVWYHYACSYDGNSIKLFLNGNQVASTTISGNIVYDSNNTQIEIGCDDNTGYNSGKVLFVNGSMPIVKLYNRGLTTAEIQQNYQSYKKRFSLS